jgi:hypothetical protein
MACCPNFPGDRKSPVLRLQPLKSKPDNLDRVPDKSFNVMVMRKKGYRDEAGRRTTKTIGSP